MKRRTKKINYKKNKRTKKRKHNIVGGTIFTPTTYNELKNEVDNYSKNNWKGKKGPIGKWDTKKITNMKELFANKTDFNEDISEWDVSNVIDMSYMFSFAFEFNQNISTWKLHPNVNVDNMFFECFIDEKNKPNISDKKNSDSDMVTDPVIENFSITHKTYINEQYKFYKNIDFKLTICDAVYLYQNIFDNYINGFLRNDHNITSIKNKELIIFFQKIIDVLDNYYINMCPKITQSMIDNKKNIIYRGEKNLCPNDECRMGKIPSFTSCSTNIEISKAFTNKNDCCIYEYVLSEGVPFINVDKMMRNTHMYCGVNLIPDHYEEEFLLPRGIILSAENKVFRMEGTIKVYRKIITYDNNYIKNNPVNLIKNENETISPPKKKNKYE